MKPSKFFYLLGQGCKSIFSHGFMSFASVTVIVACLVIMGSFSLLALNIDSLIDRMEDENEVIAYVDETYSEEEAQALSPTLSAIDNVAEAIYISRAEAMEAFLSRYSQEERETLFKDVDETIFRSRYQIMLEDITLLRQTKAELEAAQGIADVNASVEVADGFITARNVVSVVSLVLMIILAVVSVFMMSNTIRLATFSRREEIAIMKMVGATNAFIRTPFVIEGMLLGLLAGGIAYLLEWGLYTLISGRILTSVVGRLVSVIAFADLQQPLLLVYLGVGFLVGSFGSVVAIRNYLKV